jgi:hypothetical protein
MGHHAQRRKHCIDVILLPPQLTFIEAVKPLVIKVTAHSFAQFGQ